jgi:hypothetical protein
MSIISAATSIDATMNIALLLYSSDKCEKISIRSILVNLKIIQLQFPMVLSNYQLLLFLFLQDAPVAKVNDIRINEMIKVFLYLCTTLYINYLR